MYVYASGQACARYLCVCVWEREGDIDIDPGAGSTEKNQIQIIRRTTSPGYPVFASMCVCVYLCVCVCVCVSPRISCDEHVCGRLMHAHPWEAVLYVCLWQAYGCINVCGRLCCMYVCSRLMDAHLCVHAVCVYVWTHTHSLSLSLSLSLSHTMHLKKNLLVLLVHYLAAPFIQQFKPFLFIFVIFLIFHFFELILRPF